MTQSILDVRGIGPAMQIVLKKNGFKTIKDLASTTVEQLALTPGFSELKATQVINDARNLAPSIISDEKPAKVKKIKDKKKKKSKKAKQKNKDNKDNKKKKAKDKDKDKTKSKKSKNKAK